MGYKNSPWPVKFRRSQNCAKMLMIFAYDFSGVLTAHRVPTGETVNKEYYKMYKQKAPRGDWQHTANFTR